jgi:hypothetical protein
MLGMVMIHVSGRVVVRRGAGSYPLAMVLSLYVRLVCCVLRDVP